MYTFLKSVLIITSEYIGSPNSIGSHQIAKQLAKKGINTYVISFPISPFYTLLDEKTNYQYRKPFSYKFRQIDQHLYSFIPSTLIPPLPAIINTLPFYLNLWELLSPNIAKKLPEKNFDFVLSESVFYPKLLKRMKYKKLIVRLPDNLSGFWENNTPLKNAEQQLISSADILVTPSRLKAKELKNEFPDITTRYLPNGVNYSYYQENTVKPDEYHHYRYNAVYIGAIVSWFDFKLLYEAASQKKNWQFVIIGKAPDTNAPQNVKFIGEKTGYDKIAYLQHANVGIIPFDHKNNKDLINYVNPIKLYEYLAANIPVISTKWDELTFIDAPIKMIENSDDFCEQLTALELAEQSRKGSNTLTSFAKKYDWKDITEQLLAFIEP